MKKFLLLSIFLVLPLFSSIASAQKNVSCTSYVKDVPIETITATANTWANIRNRAGSISFESNAIFHKAKDAVAALKAPANFCPDGCTIRKRAVMYFRSTPQKFLSEYSDAPYCSSRETATAHTPLRYENTYINSIEDLNDWIGKLSQGEGKDGEDLYAKCAKSCSPRYEYVISRNENNTNSYTAQASIVCGHARDKDDNNYLLDAFFRWGCDQK